MSVVFGLLLLVVLCVGAWFTWQVSKESRNIGDDNRETLTILRDATTPGGEIYERGVNGTATAICTLIEDNRKLHGISTPCDKPIVEETPATPASNIYRSNEGFCFGMDAGQAERRGLVPDPTCMDDAEN